MTLYKKTAQEMFASHKKEFAEFGRVHELYKIDQEGNQPEFDRVGKPILKLIEDAERRLCMNMDSGGMGKYSSGLSEKFRNEIRTVYPLLDFVGVKIS